MVFTSVVRYVRSRGPDEFWRKRKIFKLAAGFRNRARNCYSITIRSVHRALVYATKGRKLRKADMTALWETRIRAGCDQHGIPYETLREGLMRCDVLLNRRTLADLACWEPHSFKALTDVARRRALDDGLAGITGENDVDRVITKGALRKG